MGSGAGKAARRVQAAMKVNHLGAARAFMQIVHVLRDDGQLGNVPGQCCNCQVSAIVRINLKEADVDRPTDIGIAMTAAAALMRIDCLLAGQ